MFDQSSYSVQSAFGPSFNINQNSTFKKKVNYESQRKRKKKYKC